MPRQVRVRRPPASGLFRFFYTALHDARAIAYKVLHHLFPAKAGPDDLAWTEWYEAQVAPYESPPAEMRETETEIIISAALPGYPAGGMEVTALPDCITIEGLAETRREEEHRGVYLYEVSQRTMMRQFKLPARIRTRTVRAMLEDGVLLISARKHAAVAARTMTHAILS